jgi:hypothetical protein
MGFTPSQIRQAYGIGSISLGGVTGDGTGQTIAIIDAHDDPSITTDFSGSTQNDLYKFDQQFSLPQFNSGSGTPTFTKTELTNVIPGSTYGNLPTADSGWAQEIALDVEWAHAIAPEANIVLFEAYDSTFGNILNAVQTADGTSGVDVVSMSLAFDEQALVSAGASLSSVDSTYFATAGISYTAAAGDSGQGDTGISAAYPASSPNVISVGGTSLTLSGGTWSSEKTWNSSGPATFVSANATGGGISSNETRPFYQSLYGASGSSYRALPDVSFDADPNTGVAVYDSYNGGVLTPWYEIGGTSVGAPAWAGLVSIADQLRPSGVGSLSGASQTLPALYSAAESGQYHDITSGNNTIYNSNGTVAHSGYSATLGYDDATGVGTPIANAVVESLAQSLVIRDTTGAGATITLGSGSTSVTVNGSTNTYSTSLTMIDFYGSTSSDALTVKTDGTAAVNGIANSAGTLTAGGKTIAFQNAGTLNLYGISGSDTFAANSWVGGSLNLATAGGTPFFPNAINLYLGATAIRGGAVSATGGNTNVAAYGDGALSINGTSFGTGSTGTIAGSGASVSFSTLLTVSLIGQSGNDQFTVTGWTSGALNLFAVGNNSSNLVEIDSNNVSGGSFSANASGGVVRTVGDGTIQLAGSATVNGAGTITLSSATISYSGTIVGSSVGVQILGSSGGDNFAVNQWSAGTAVLSEAGSSTSNSVAVHNFTGGTINTYEAGGTLFTNADGTVQLNGYASGTGVITFGTSGTPPTITYAGTVVGSTTGVTIGGIGSSVDTFIVNGWGYGTAVVSEAGSSVSNSVVVHSLTGGTLYTAEAGGTLYTNADGVVKLTGYGSGSGAITFGTSGTPPTLAYTGTVVSATTGVTIAGIGSSTDSFVVNQWGYGTAVVSEAGSSTSNSVAVHNLTGGTVYTYEAGGTLYTDADGAVNLTGYGSGSGVITFGTSGTPPALAYAGTVVGSTTGVTIAGIGSSADKFIVNEWGYGTAVLSEAGSSASNDIQVHDFTAGTLNLAAAGGTIEAYSDGNVNLTGYALYQGAITFGTTGTLPQINYVGANTGLSIVGVGSSADVFTVYEWIGGTGTIQTAGSGSSKSVVLYRDNIYGTGLSIVGAGGTITTPGSISKTISSSNGPGTISTAQATISFGSGFTAS